MKNSIRLALLLSCIVAVSLSAQAPNPGDFVLSDAGSAAVVAVSPTGFITPLFAGPPLSDVGPSAVDAAGTVWVTAGLSLYRVPLGARRCW